MVSTLSKKPPASNSNKSTTGMTGIPILVALGLMQMLLLWLQYHAQQEPCELKQKEPLEYGYGYADADADADKDKQTAWQRAISEAEQAFIDHAQTQKLPSCLVPNTERTASIVKEAVERRKQQSSPDDKPLDKPLVPLPILNMGMPKCGSTTLYSFFDCIGLRATHWNIHTDEFEGLCMRDAVIAGQPPLKTCARKKDALLQMDVGHPFNWKTYGYTKSKHRDDCFFPQLSLKEEFHKENPNATFVLMFRPIDHWIKSIAGWYSTIKQFRDCDLPNLPRGVPADVEDGEQVYHAYMVMFCSQVIHLRNFVEEHGNSHALIELDLYDTETSKEVMSSLFPSRNQKGKSARKCWEHKNKNRNKKKTNIEFETYQISGKKKEKNN